jgi:hypothetical protein
MIINHTVYIIITNNLYKPKTIPTNTVLIYLELYQEDSYYKVSTLEDIVFLAN